MFERILENKTIIMIIFCILIYGLYIFKDRMKLFLVQNNDKKVYFDETNNKILEFDKNNMGDTFIPSERFEGKKYGYIFKSDTLGVGYYLDK